LTRALTEMGRVNTLPPVWCSAFSSPLRAAESQPPVVVHLLRKQEQQPPDTPIDRVPGSVINFAVLLSTSFVSSKEQTSLQGTRSLSLRSCRVGISISRILVGGQREGFPKVAWVVRGSGGQEFAVENLAIKPHAHGLKYNSDAGSLLNCEQLSYHVFEVTRKTT